ncbi:hypothetical protein F4703DRAFT_1891266 [Phycomyces blakesleeanus]
MVSLWWGQSALDEMIEKATSELLPVGQEDLGFHLEISDQLRSKRVNAKDCMHALKRRLGHKNPNVQLATLSLTDTCVKNGGDQFVREVASMEFMDEMVKLVAHSSTQNPDVTEKALSIIQTWGLAARGNPSLSYMADTYNLLKAKGYKFPAINEAINSSLLETAAAPEWTDSDVCERCRTPFTLTNRKHHCRQCGHTFCNQCSSKTMPLLHLAIEEEVRVCDGCYIKLKLAKVSKKDVAWANNNTSIISSPSPVAAAAVAAVPSNSQNHANGTPSGEDDLDEDMKRAIELSLKEEEQRKNGYGAGYVATQKPSAEPAQCEQQRQSNDQNEEEEDPELAAAIAASLRELQLSAPPPTQPGYQPSSREINSNDLTPVEMENVQLFSTLMERVHASGGDVSNDPQVNRLYEQIGALQPKLIKSLDETIHKHRTFVSMHEKLAMAVKSYDRLLEERVSGANARSEMNQASAYSYYPPMQSNGSYSSDPNGYPAQQQQQQQQQRGYYPYPETTQPATSAPEATQYYPSEPYYQTQQPSQSFPQQPYYEAQNYPQQHPQQHPQQSYPPYEQASQHLQQPKQPVEEAPLIDL